MNLESHEWQNDKAQDKTNNLRKGIANTATLLLQPHFDQQQNQLLFDIDMGDFY